MQISPWLLEATLGISNKVGGGGVLAFKHAAYLQVAYSQVGEQWWVWNLH